jgi:N-acetylglucosamine-6-phosphate deacetylase
MLLNYHTYSASRIFSGENWLENHVVIVHNGRIKSVEPLTGSSSRRVTQFDDCTIVPAFIDLQVYGANGKLLAAYPEPGLRYHYPLLRPIHPKFSSPVLMR